MPKVYSLDPNYVTNLALFELEVSGVQDSVPKIPLLGSSPYGFTESNSSKIELAPSEPISSLYTVKSSQMELLFELMDPNRRYAAQLIATSLKDEDTSKYSRYVACSVENDQLRLIIRSPGPGRYGLVLYKGSDERLTQFAAILIDFESDAQDQLPESFFNSNPNAAAQLGLLLEARKLGIRLMRGSKSYQSVELGGCVKFELEHEKNFFMMLKSNTTSGNYGVSYKTEAGSAIVFKPPETGTYPLQLFCGETAKSLSLSASFFVTCSTSDRTDQIHPFPKPVYGSWGPVGATLEKHHITCISNATLIGFHQSSQVEFHFGSEESSTLAFDCKQYVNGENVENARNCVMQTVNKFNFSAQSAGVYRLIIVKVPEKVPVATFLIEANDKGELLPETSALWGEFKMRVKNASLVMGGAIIISAHTSAAPSEIIVAYNDEQHVVPQSNIKDDDDDEEEEVYTFEHQIEHKVRSDLTLAIKKNDTIVVLAVYKMQS